MHYVAFTGRKECIKELLKLRGDVNVKSSLGTMPLRKALEGAHQEVVETPIEAGAGVNISRLYGRAPLRFAAAMGQEHAALYLLRSGAGTDIGDAFGSTACDVAVRYNHNSIAEALKPYKGTDDSASPVRGEWLLRREAGETEETGETGDAKSLHTSDTQDQDRNPRLSFDRLESASTVEGLDVVISEWKSLSSNVHARLKGNAKGYSPKPFAESKKGSLLNPIPMFSGWAHGRQGK
jgi:ankyrin repeat protein